MLAILDQPSTRPTTREIIAAATATQDTHDPDLSAARYELFRRALVEQDEAAWETLYHAYECLLASWISKRVQVPLEEYADLIGQIWMKLLRNIRTAEKFASFANLGALLAYLKCCMGSVVVDYIRARNREKGYLSLETIQEEEHEQIGYEDDLAQTVCRDDWQRLISPLLRTDKERLIVQVVLVEGEKPATLLTWYPHLFSSIEDVYWTRRRLVERLQRSQVLKAAYEEMR